MMNRTYPFAAVLIAVMSLTVLSASDDAKKLTIVFLLGQSEMLGHADISTAQYMLEKPLLPPAQQTLNAHKGNIAQINSAYLYWKAMHAYQGPKKFELKKLIEERAKFKNQFRQHIIDELEKNNGHFRGRFYSKRRGFWLYNMGDQEAEAKGYTPKIRAILDAPDNPMNLQKAYDTVLADANARYQRQSALNEIFFGTDKNPDFEAYQSGVNGLESESMSRGQRRRAYTELAEKHLNMPRSKRTYIASIGQESESTVLKGKLGIGYGANAKSIGLEYATGLALESKWKGPILIVKCAWNDESSVKDFWQSPSMESKTFKDGSIWDQRMSLVRSVLANPGMYHPDYDAEAGYDLAGMICFQGRNEAKNEGFALQFGTYLIDFRELIADHRLPVLCLAAGEMAFQGDSDNHLANVGMRDLSIALGSDVQFMETYKWFPSEFSVLEGLFHKRKLKSPEMQVVIAKSTTKQGRRGSPYYGSASFYLLAGYEAGLKLAGMTSN